MKTESKNALLLSIIVLLQTLTIPIKSIMQSGLSLYIIVILIIIIFLKNNKLNLKIIAFFVILTLIFSLSAIFSPKPIVPIFIFFESLKLGFIYMWLSSSKLNLQLYFKSSFYLAIIGLGILISEIFFFNQEQTINYMSIGVQLNYIMIPFIFSFFNEKKFLKILSGILISITIILTFIYGNRMSGVIQIVLVIVGDITFNKINTIKGVASKTFILILGVLVYLNLDRILIYLLEFTSNLGFYSYSLNKIYSALTGNIGIDTILSGRNSLFNEAVDIIIENDFMPNGIGYYDAVTNNSYPHNFILELFIEFGFIAIPILLLFLFVIMKILSKIKGEARFFYLSYLFLSLFRLSVSGSYWTEMSIWIVMGFSIQKYSLFNFNNINIRDKVYQQYIF